MPWVRAYCNPAEAGGVTSPLDGTQLAAEFTDSAPSEDGVAVSSGCHTYSASYDDNGGDLCRLLAALP